MPVSADLARLLTATTDSPLDFAEVTTVTPAAAADGNALVTVLWRGAEVTAAYSASYSPTAGDTVVVSYFHRVLFIHDKAIGHPA